jgi:hypothetical protein
VLLQNSILQTPSLTGNGIYSLTMVKPANISGTQRNLRTESRLKIDNTANLVSRPPALKKLQLLLNGQLTNSLNPRGTQDYQLVFSLEPPADIDSLLNVTAKPMRTIRVELSADGGTTWRPLRRTVTQAANGDYVALIAPNECPAAGGALGLRITASNRDLTTYNENPPKDLRLTYSFWIKLMG